MSLNATIKLYIALLLPLLLFSSFIPAPVTKKAYATVSTSSTTSDVLYNQLQLNKLELSRKAFSYALQGVARLKSADIIKNDSIISIVDFSLPSYKKRLFVINLNSGQLLFHTFVAHGRNSGVVTATHFSNDLNSLQSSLGFYVTADTYNGEHGYSLRLQGIEKGINDRAFERGIVMHSAAYVDESLIKSQGYIGRSFGCPAVPIALHKQIIEAIRNGSCLFIYSSNAWYAAHSKIIS